MANIISEIDSEHVLNDFERFLRQVTVFASMDYLINLAFKQRVDVLFLVYRNYTNDDFFLPDLLGKLEASLSDPSYTLAKSYLIEKFIIPSLEKKIIQGEINYHHLLQFINRLVTSGMCSRQLLFDIFKSCTTDVLAFDILKRFKTSRDDVAKLLAGNRFKGLTAATTIDDLSIYASGSSGTSLVCLASFNTKDASDTESTEMLLTELFKRGMLPQFKLYIYHNSYDPAAFLCQQTEFSRESLVIVNWIVTEFYFDSNDYLACAHHALPWINYCSVDSSKNNNRADCASSYCSDDDNDNVSNNNNISKELVDLCLTKAVANKQDLAKLFFHADLVQTRRNMLDYNYITIEELELCAVGNTQKNTVLLEKHRVDSLKAAVSMSQPPVMHYHQLPIQPQPQLLNTQLPPAHPIIINDVSDNSSIISSGSSSISVSDESSDTTSTNSHSSYEEVEYASGEE